MENFEAEVTKHGGVVELFGRRFYGRAATLILFAILFAMFDVTLLAMRYL